MIAERATSSEAWLLWFEQSKLGQTRRYLCRKYNLDPFLADAIINTARLQVWKYWHTIDKPLPFFLQTLRHEAGKHLDRLHREQRRLEAYATQQRRQEKMAERIAHGVTDLLEFSSNPRHQQMLEWFVQGYDDTQVAAWLGITPGGVRKARHAAYAALRQRLRTKAATGRSSHTGLGS